MAQLPSTATIKDIIAALQSIEAINQKADLAAVVGNPAVSTDDVATIITKLQNAKNSLAANLTAQGQIVSGSDSLASLASKVVAAPAKRWATGSVPAASIVYDGTPGNNCWKVTVSGLAFQPKVILGSTWLNGENYVQYANASLLSRSDYLGGGDINYMYVFGSTTRTEPAVTLTANGFIAKLLASNAYSPSYSFKFIAFE